VISKANQYARDHGLAPFVSDYLLRRALRACPGQVVQAVPNPLQVIYQGRWSAAVRDLERDLLPMCREEGMAIAPWGAIGQGRFQRKADQGKSKDGRSAQKLSEDEIKVSAALEKVADELKVESITAVATAYVMSKVSGAIGHSVTVGRETLLLLGRQRRGVIERQS
jgi:aryl-alcohol dehydrogenase-like predicted oxidoreductase